MYMNRPYDMQVLSVPRQGDIQRGEREVVATKKTGLKKV